MKPTRIVYAKASARQKASREKTPRTRVVISRIVDRTRAVRVEKPVDPEVDERVRVWFMTHIYS